MLLHSTTPSAVRVHAPLLSDLLPEQVDPPLQPSDIDNPPLTHILALNLQLDVPPLQPSSMRAPPPTPLYFSLQGRGEPPILSPTVRTYVTLLSDFLLWQEVPLYHSSADPDTLPQISS